MILGNTSCRPTRIQYNSWSTGTSSKNPFPILHYRGWIHHASTIYCSLRHREHLKGGGKNGFNKIPTNTARKHTTICWQLKRGWLLQMDVSSQRSSCARSTGHINRKWWVPRLLRASVNVCVAFDFFCGIVSILAWNISSCFSDENWTVYRECVNFCRCNLMSFKMRKVRTFLSGLHNLERQFVA